MKKKNKKEILVKPAQKGFIYIFDIIICIILIALVVMFFRFNDYVFIVMLSLVLAFTFYSLIGIAKLKQIETSKPLAYRSDYTRGKVQPYSGNKPYIFISYSHDKADRKRVEPILQLLYDNGYRIWYNPQMPMEGQMQPYSLDMLNNSWLFMPLISEKYNDSINCLNELAWAREHNKIITPIYLDAGDENVIQGAQNAIDLTKNLSPEEVLNYFNYLPYVPDCREA